MGTTLIVPGLGGSGPDHWQSWLERRLAGSARVTQARWHVPDLEAWSRQVAAAVEAAPRPVWIVAHSFGCLAAIHAAAGASPHGRIAGLMLVAPADPGHWGHERLFLRPLAAPAMLVASRDDPWMTGERARLHAGRWGASLVDLGAVGHINVEAGFGPWPQGLSLLERFRRGHGQALSA